MEEKRAKTLDALSSFIHSQKALLERARTDITRLTQLRNDIATTPAESCDYETFKDQLAIHRLGERTDIVPALPDGFDWSAFAACDPTPFRTLAASTRHMAKQRDGPSPKQASPLSPLQQLVKDARASIIDPVRNAFPPVSSDEEEEPPDPEELKRIREREKIRELKRRIVHGGSGFHGRGGLGIRRADADAVFVREDLEDESAEVDISLEDPGATMKAVIPKSERVVRIETDRLMTPLGSSFPSAKDQISSVARPQRSSRAKRLSRKDDAPAQPLQSSSSRTTEEQPTEEEATKVDKKGKARPETYKQAWSVEEQHLLERLLEEIPEGEKNRWQKISKAMNGKRTSRQVASRVQKYYEKLKRYGLGVGGGGVRTNDS
ncbi:hypothetical protein BDW22DRAFT_1357867 [Trametopsis cervina]|nr:hypothetical protein BDW22DRAFT_1357867 [Trametopsis cervina]